MLDSEYLDCSLADRREVSIAGDEHSLSVLLSETSPMHVRLMNFFKFEESTRESDHEPAFETNIQNVRSSTG